MADDWLREARRRLLGQPEAGCWLALIVRAIEPETHSAPDRDEHTPAHFLVGAWAPSEAGLYPRLPEFAAIASPDAQRALRELFVHLPPDVRVHLVDETVADAALLSDMVLACDTNLEPYQRAALERFAARRRTRLRDEILRRYTDREGDFERFRGRVLGGEPGEGPSPEGEPPQGGPPSGRPSPSEPQGGG